MKTFETAATLRKLSYERSTFAVEICGLPTVDDKDDYEVEDDNEDYDECEDWDEYDGDDKDEDEVEVDNNDYDEYEDKDEYDCDDKYEDEESNSVFHSLGLQKRKVIFNNYNALQNSPVNIRR